MPFAFSVDRREASILAAACLATDPFREDAALRPVIVPVDAFLPCLTREFLPLHAPRRAVVALDRALAAYSRTTDPGRQGLARGLRRKLRALLRDAPRRRARVA